MSAPKSPFANRRSVPTIPPAADGGIRGGIPAGTMSVLSSVTSPSKSILSVALLPIKRTDIDSLGKEADQHIQRTVERITHKFAVADFGDLGDILNNVQVQADRLDVSDYTAPGFIGWIRRSTTNMKRMLMKRLQSAGGAFDTLETRMVNQIAVLEEWDRDLQRLYDENLHHYQYLNGLTNQGMDWARQMEGAIARFPVIDPNDPDAFMKSQLYSEADATHQYLLSRIDTFKRLRVITETTGPKIRAKQQAARAMIGTFRQTIREVIPMVKMEFTMFIHNLELQKSIKLINTARDLGDAALRQNADSTKVVMMDATKTSSAPVVSIDTLNHIRSRMLETVVGVKQLNAEAEQQRAADSIAMDKSRADYIAAIQQLSQPTK